MKYVQRVFGCDLRTLALYRIGLGIALLLEQYQMASRLAVDGKALTDKFHGGTAGTPLLSFHSLNDGILFQTCLLILFTVAAVILIVGYRTRWTMVVCWVLLVSLQSHNAEVLHEGDKLLAVLMFLGIFLPLGARYSVDSALDQKSKHGNLVVSVATATLLIQVSLVYFMAAVGSLGTNIELGDAQIPGAALVYLGFALPVAAFSSILHTSLRLLLIISLILAQIIGSHVLDLGSYPLAGCIALFAFTPSGAWDYLARRIDRTKRGTLRIYFDRDCGFCHKICLLFRTFLVLGDTPVIPAQDNAAAFAIMQQHNSWVIYDHDDKPYVRWHALLLLLRRSPIFWPFGWILTAAKMGQWGDCLYETVARNRNRLSRLTAVLWPYRTISVRIGTAANAAVGLWLALVLALNTPAFSWEGWGSTGANIRHAIGLEQSWHVLGINTSVIY